MSLKYIRDCYGVPAYRGARIRFTPNENEVWEGRITSARMARLRVLVDDRVPGYRGRLTLHPTWNVEYL